MIPVLVKEWRRLLRAPSTPWLLLAYLLVPALASAAYLSTDNLGPAGMVAQMVPLMGARALAGVAVWQLLLLCVTAAWLGSSLVAAEVEGRTLEPLLAAGGRLPGLLIGKLAAVLGFLVLMMLAGLPVFALPMLIGGITWTMLGRILLLELAWAAGMGALGLAISAMARRSGSAGMVAAGLALAVTLGAPLLAGLTSGVGPVRGFAEGVELWPALVLRFRAAGSLLAINPFMGVGSVVGSAGTPALFGLPPAGPVLWWKQAAGLPVAAAMGWLWSWMAMAVRLHWRRPVWLRLRKEKAVTAHG